MKQRVRVQKSAPAAETTDTTETNRLTGISVNEVSIVDRAANQRRYLIVKEDKQAAFPPPAGGAPPPAAPPAGQPPAPPPPAPQLKVSPEFKAKVVGVLRAASEKIAIIQKALETAAETPGVPPPQELMDALTGLSGMFATAPPAPPAAPPAPAAAPPAPAMKAGKKISAARLALISDAKAALDKIISDVSGADDADDAEPEKTEKSAESTTTTTTLEPAAPVVNDELASIRTSIEGLAGLVGKMTQLFEGQNSRIDQLTKARGQSRQVDLDKAGGARREEKVVWDMDMAKPAKAIQ